MHVILLQLNYRVGDIQNNLASIKKTIEQNQDADLFVTSELAATGYPLQDKLLQTSFFSCLQEQLALFATSIKNMPPLLLGTPYPIHNNLYSFGNACLFIANGKIQQVIYKTLLPNYNVFNESRYFQAVPDQELPIITVQNKRIAITICEDLWYDEVPHLYLKNPLDRLVNQNLDLLVNISASPFDLQQHQNRKKHLSKAHQQLNCPVAYVNQIAANDELIFDGHSLYLSQEGIFQEAACFEEDSISFILDQPIQAKQQEYNCNELYWKALVLGIKDYFHKSGFTKAVLGLSGGIDSALCAAVATYALGKDNVQALLLPSLYSSQASITDALALATELGIQTKTVPITDILYSFQTALPYKKTLTEENLQARIRGNLLMSYAAEQSSLLLTTSNKSEIAVGYSTLYGDACGALSVIGDLWKTEVFSLVHWLEENQIVCIPKSIQNKPPSAELRPEQKDEDSLPPYEILDPILQILVVEKASLSSLIEQGFDKTIVHEIASKIEQAEFKRFQSAPILRLSKQSLGTSWQMPLASASSWLC